MLKKLIPARGRRLLRAALNRHKERKRLRRGYNEIAVEDVSEYLSLDGASVLVVGANTGEDCRRFLKRGSAQVHGLDIMENVGANFPHPRAAYYRQSIEKTDLPSGQFDLVFAVATMEHVPDINSAFAEMARLTKPGGIIFSSAAPLWESPYGHHMTCFNGHPWVHLLFDRAGLANYAKENNIKGDWEPIESVAEYMLDRSNFNMRPARDYVAACSAIQGLDIIENKLDLDDASLLAHPLGRRAQAMGFAPESLLATRHLLVAKKSQ